VLPPSTRGARGHQRHDIAVFLEDDVAEARIVDRRARTAVGSFLIGQAGLLLVLPAHIGDDAARMVSLLPWKAVSLLTRVPMPDPNKGSAMMQAVRAMSKAFIDHPPDQKVFWMRTCAPISLSRTNQCLWRT
jgi:hypothetical protein